MKTSLFALLAGLITLVPPALAQQPSDEDIAARIEKLVEMADPRGDEARKGDLPYRAR
ncbi:hypothetical protein Q8W25_06670 [Shimia thalassica]|uniref:hypothetical protein n=1 Tax=Shimia thalassica TaxID=1715693 RepID=UPI0027329924|nr:hypothetical protein [Shimia thalassica]MDP2493694.1 hypothetical protein [Shimia thalassica]